MGPRGEQCDKCYFFEAGETGENKGWCLRLPPVPVFADDIIISSQAETDPVEWCGEYKSLSLTLLSKEPVSVLDLSKRSRNVLHRAGIVSVGELVDCSIDELLQMRNFGKTCLTEIIEKLAAKGLWLKGESEK